MKDVIIIGGGPSGLSAALNLLRSGKSVLILEKNNFGGQIANSPRVENLPSIKEVSGADFASQFFDQVTALGAEFELEEVLENILAILSDETAPVVNVEEKTTNEDVTIDVVEDKILTKLYEVAGLLQKIAAPISIITFIIGAIIMVTGALGKKDGARTGIIVCVLSIVMYAVCMYSEPIIVAVANWMAS